MMERSELPLCDKWAIEDLYADDALWEAERKSLCALGDELAGYHGRLCESAQTLYDFLQKSDELSVLADRLGNYASRRHDEDTRKAEYQAMYAAINRDFVRIQSQTAFTVPELMAISDEALDGLYEAKPELTLYKRHLADLRRRRSHTLSEREEALLAAAGEMARTPENVFSLFSDADLQFESAADGTGELHPITQGTYIACLESPDRVLRKNAFDNYYAAYGAYRNTVAGMLSGQVKQLEFFASARNYPSALDASLDDTNVPTAVYRQLIEAVHQNIDKLHRYVRLRKKLLGLDELHYYDLYTPLVPDADTKIDFDDAKKTVREALSVMGEAYLAILDEGFRNRWIDVYENPGKRSGAYSAGARVHPYILLNYTGTLDSQFTLAHEMGHAIHSYLSNKHQPVVYSDYVIFVAEVASTCNESLLMAHLLKKAQDKKERAYLINHFLEQFKGTLYRQTMFAEFELKIAELNAAGEALTADRLCEEYRKLTDFYYGPDIVSDDAIALEWARIPHFYYDYYVFQYATGYAAAVALSGKILNEGAPAVEKYLEFLSGGCSKDPIDLLRGAGVDMATTAPVEQALALFDDLMDEMEALMV